MESKIMPKDSFTVSSSPQLLRDIIPLDFRNVQNVPDSHAWSGDQSTKQDDDLLLSDEPLVPVVDLARGSDSSPADIQPIIRSACENWGVFRVINHGVPLDLLDQVENQTMKLFSLPADRKARAARTPQCSTGYGVLPVSSVFNKLLWSEGFTISGSPLMEHAIKLWPDQEQERFTFCDVFVEYQKEMKLLAEKLFGIMLSSLGLSDLDQQDQFKWFKAPAPAPEHGSSDPTLVPRVLLNLNYYPPCPDPTRAVGLVPHTDSSLITLLYPSAVNSYGGLQAVSEDDTCWVSCEPMRGGIVVILGDLMHILTNGRFKSVKHRAVVDKERSRTSRVYFYGPPNEVLISSPAKLVDETHPAMFKPVTWEELLKAKRKYLSKALDTIRSI
ncbi:gibberellin 3-beta-dioxygenase 3-like [Rutidosis leptorrhynchoides]|uniref:gibberellin 3-beta-dioxygenase 3-like n=1 Tax=Rutidosis leptorrhynchoides TaxID=125765 RepID=UPI003A99E6E0